MTLSASSQEGVKSDDVHSQHEEAKQTTAYKGNNNGRRSTSIVTPRDKTLPGIRNRSVMSDVVPQGRLSFLPIIRRSSMASSVNSSIKSSSLYSSSTGSNSPMSGPSTGFCSPAKLKHLPRVLMREIQPSLFDMQDEMMFNTAMRLPQLDTSPTDCRLNLVAQKLQEGDADNTTCHPEYPTQQFPDSAREQRQSRDSDRDQNNKRKRKRNRKRSEQRRKEQDLNEKPCL